MARVPCAMDARKDTEIARRKYLNTIIKENIAKVFSCQEKKEKNKLNKFEALSIFSASDTRDSNNKSKVSCTSGKGLDSK
eukprot:3848205-Ditylum_brightwellii.AAC.1